MILIAETGHFPIVMGSKTTMTPQSANAPDERPPEGRTEFVCDKAAVVEIYPAIQSYVFSRLGWQLGEDATSETLRGILKGLAGVRAKTKADFRKYCFRVAYNQINNVLRSKCGGQAAPLDPSHLEDSVGAGSNAYPLPPGICGDLMLVLALLDASKVPCGQFLYEYYITGLEFKEIAAMIGVSVGAMRMKIARCLAAAERIAKTL